MQDIDTVRKVIKNRTTRGRSSSIAPRNDKEPRKRKKGQEGFKTQEKYSSLGTMKVGKVAKGINIPYSSTIQALRVYHDRHSNLILPRRFVVPVDEDYPRKLHGLDLAGTVYDMKWWQRHVKQRPERVAELNELGFVWERLQPEWNLVLEGLMAYGTKHSNLLVPSKFIVPYERSWPKATWGLALGNCVYRIRNRGDFLQGCNAWSRRDQLDSIGFVWDTREQKFDVFCTALRLYSDIEARDKCYNRVSALKVPSRFVVPHDDDAWPKDIWGYKLGAKCTAVRQKELYVKGHPERLMILATIGFHIGGNDSLSWLEVVHAAAVYSQMNGRKLDVPAGFVVPAPPKIIINDNDSLETSVVGSNDAWPWPGMFKMLVGLSHGTRNSTPKLLTKFVSALI
jgi:hypothetical protein